MSGQILSYKLKRSGLQVLPWDGQLETGPGCPLIVWASETLGANPEFRASLTTASVSDFHHSPTLHH